MKIPLKICVLFLVVALLAAPTVSAKKTNEYTARSSVGNASEITIPLTDSVRQGEQTDIRFLLEMVLTGWRYPTTGKIQATHWH